MVIIEFCFFQFGEPDIRVHCGCGFCEDLFLGYVLFVEERERQRGREGERKRWRMECLHGRVLIPP